MEVAALLTHTMDKAMDNTPALKVTSRRVLASTLTSSSVLITELLNPRQDRASTRKLLKSTWHNEKRLSRRWSRTQSPLVDPTTPSLLTLLQVSSSTTRTKLTDNRTPTCSINLCLMSTLSRVVTPKWAEASRDNILEYLELNEIQIRNSFFEKIDSFSKTQLKGKQLFEYYNLDE